jgi:hypothetical protein
LAELYVEKNLIEDNTNPIRYYNYSYIKDLLKENMGTRYLCPS